LGIIVLRLVVIFVLALQGIEHVLGRGLGAGPIVAALQTLGHFVPDSSALARVGKMPMPQQ